MNTGNNLIAIGRSRYLYEGIKHMVSKGYVFKAIVTEEAYEEYDIKHTDFEQLAGEIKACFFKIKSLNNEDLVNIVKDNNIRVAISVNWKYTIPKSFLDLFECGILNFHLGSLPDYKGNATVNWAIINDEDHIYGNIHKMDPALDAGDVVARKSIPITSETYISDILKQAEEMVPGLYEEAVAKVLEKPDAYVVKGTTEGSRCYPRLPEDGQISWNQSAENIGRLVRANSHPYKGAFSFLNGEKVTIWKAKPYYPESKFFAVPGHVVTLNKTAGSIMVACSEGMLEVLEIERDGEVITPTDFIKSIRVRFKEL